MTSTDEATQSMDSYLQLVVWTQKLNSAGWAAEETFQQPSWPADDVKVLTKDLQELTQPNWMARRFSLNIQVISILI